MSKSYRLLFPLLALLLVAALLPGVSSAEGIGKQEECIVYNVASTSALSSTFLFVNLPLVMGKAGPLSDELVCSLADISTEDVCVVDNYAYVVNTEEGLKILDISDPHTPMLIGSCELRDRASRIHVYGDYAYIAGSNYLSVVDISNPTWPSVVSRYISSGTVFDIYVEGNYAYEADQAFGLRIYDVTNPRSPRQLTGVSTRPSFAVHRVYVSAGYAYLACESGWLVVDVRVPNEPVVVNGWLKEDLSTPYAVYASGNYCYFADGETLWVLSSAISANPTAVLGFCDTPGDIWGIYAEEDYVYAAGDYNGVCTINVSDPASPLVTGIYEMPQRALEIDASNGYLYVADDKGGFFILN